MSAKYAIYLLGEMLANKYLKYLRAQLREVNELYVSGIKNIRNTKGICAIFRCIFMENKGFRPKAYGTLGAEMILDSTGLSQLPVAAKQDGRGYNTKKGVRRKHHFASDPDKKMHMHSSCHRLCCR